MSQPWERDRELNHLHPVFRRKVNTLLDKLSSEALPFRLFEGLRSPQRQQYLYNQGRTTDGNIVTYTGPWSSFHQYGLAADFVLYEGGWSWDDSGEKARWWERLHELAREQGMEPLSWENPHLQLPDMSIARLRNGVYPPDGDLTWSEGLQEAIFSWSGEPSAPPPPSLIPDRPPIGEGQTPTIGEGETPPPGNEDWHSLFNGRQWRHDDRGVYIRDHADALEPMRTPGKPITCRAIRSLFSHEIGAASIRFGIPPAIIMMVIAVETSFARKNGFTGPRTFRWEPHVEVGDVSPTIYGDYSAGPMQTLATTARWAIRTRKLDFLPFSTAPVLDEKPPDPPPSLPLFDPAVSIEIGAAVIKQRMEKTGDDPILIAAAYNAGGLYESDENPWRLRTTGDHLDRAARWYGDACAVMKE